MLHPGFLTSLIGFALVLGPLVFVHELGHYLVGRWCGVRADQFSIGFGPELFGWTDRRGTRWKVSALPLGGYVQFAGDMNPAGQPSAEWLALPERERNSTFQAKALWQRALIVLAGPLTNLLVALVILSGFAMAFGRLDIPPEVGTVVPGSAAARAGLVVGDRITAIDGAAVGSFLDIKLAVAQHPAEQLTFAVVRRGQTVALRVIPAEKRESDRFGNVARIGFIGIGPARAQLVAVGPLEAVGDGLHQMHDIAGMMVTGIGQIVRGQRAVQELGGPIKIARYSGEQLVSGWQPFVFFVALISINLGFINLLPIPVLDGGHLVFYALEALRRRPLGAKEQAWAFRTGLALVLTLMLLVTANDLLALLPEGSTRLASRWFGG